MPSYWINIPQEIHDSLKRLEREGRIDSKRQYVLEAVKEKLENELP